MILRDKDANTSWGSAADGTMEERRYILQNWRADASAIVTEAGKLVEWVKYSSYGVPWALPTGDTDSDGDWDSTDSAAITGSYELRKDTELDGDVDANDVTHANAPTGAYQTLGRGVLSSTGVANRKGYAGYEGDGKLAGMKWHVRNRVLDSELGRWGRRDPVRTSHQRNALKYAIHPLSGSDPLGQAYSRICRSGGCGSINPPGNIQPQPDPSIIDPWHPAPWHPYYLDQCARACQLIPGADAVSWCIDGEPFICICENTGIGNNPFDPTWEPSIVDTRDDFQRCLLDFERRNWSDGIVGDCPKDYTGPPIPPNQDDESRRQRFCAKAANHRTKADCLRGIDCAQESTDLGRRMCEFMKCVLAAADECAAGAFDIGCQQGVTPETMQQMIEALDACAHSQPKFEQDCGGRPQ